MAFHVPYSHCITIVTNFLGVPISPIHSPVILRKPIPVILKDHKGTSGKPHWVHEIHLNSSIFSIDSSMVRNRYGRLDYNWYTTHSRPFQCQTLVELYPPTPSAFHYSPEHPNKKLLYPASRHYHRTEFCTFTEMVVAPSDQPCCVSLFQTGKRARAKK